LAFYRTVEESAGRGLFHELPMLRLLDSEVQVAKWRRRMETPGYAQCLAEEELQAGEDLHSEFGGFTLGRTGYLDTRAFIEATKAELGGDWRVGEVVEPVGDGVTVFCEGLAAAGNPLFDWVPFRPAKGEVLTVAVAGLAEDRIVNRGGVWLLPLGGGRFRAGATYDWEARDCDPTPDGRSTIEGRLRRLLRVPFEVVEHCAGVRPVVRASKLLCGLHPAREDVGFFNGLGSKGVLTAPFFARAFAAFLCGEGEIDPEVDLRKNM
jgi:glycine oxidase